MSAEIASAYETFLAGKAPRAVMRGLSRTPSLSSHLFPFQRSTVQFLLQSGAGGLFLDTGLGKTLVQLEYAEHARQTANGYALILCPLAVAHQIEKEGRKFGYPTHVIRDQSQAREGINICNYDRLHLIEPDRFGVVTLDEASILKSFTGKTTRRLIDAFEGHRWKVPATATPAPNDHGTRAVRGILQCDGVKRDAGAVVYIRSNRDGPVQVEGARGPVVLGLDGVMVPARSTAIRPRRRRRRVRAAADCRSSSPRSGVRANGDRRTVRG
jgi:hypothetical protein